MILSRRHRFIFIKGLKVGGTSVEIALSTICGPEDIVSPISPIDELSRLAIKAGARNYSDYRSAELAYQSELQQTAVSDLKEFPMPAALYFNHMSLRDIVQLQGPDVLNYEVIAIERHPYAKIISWANHKLSYEAYKIGGDMRADLKELKKYLERTVQDGSIIAVRNIDRYRRPDGSILANIMRYENLASDFEAFVKRLGISSCPLLPHAKRGILANTLDARDFFSTQHINIINRLFQEEFEAFQYEPIADPPTGTE